MDIVTTSLEALIQRATSNQNQCPDTAAIDAFCGLVNREPECAQMAARFITAKVHSLQEWEALQALHVLDACMKKCGSSFHAEVGKFRFLNELIKLVSPKYLGAHTPEPVRRRVLELMQSWTIRYPKETKIKEAYEMLKKQGVVKEERIGTIDMHRSVDSSSTTASSNATPSRQQNSIFQDEEKSRLLQRLLQSKNPDDLQAANRLIKTMVKEDERRVEQKVRHVSELEAVHNNARLLTEMLDSYRPGISSAQDLELITELHTSCQRLRPTVFKLASEVHTDESLFNEVLAANDELGDVFDKYAKVIVQGKPVQSGNNAGGSSLLDLSTPSEELLPPPVSLLNEQLADLGLDVVSGKEISISATTQLPQTSTKQQSVHEQASSDFAVLGEIFNSPANSASSVSCLPPLQPISSLTPNLLLGIKHGGNTGNGSGINMMEHSEEKSNKLKALEDLDILGATLLKENLPQIAKHNKVPSKVPMNQLNKITDSLPTSPLHNNQSTSNSQPQPASTTNLMSKTNDILTSNNIDFLIGSVNNISEPSLPNDRVSDSSNLISDLVSTSAEPADVSLLENTKLFTSTANSSPVVESNIKSEVRTPVSKKEQLVKPLGDLHVTLESIKPGTLPPRTLLDEKNGITVMLHVSLSRPRPDVTVFVVTATSKNTSPLSDYLFQPVVPKTCRLKLQPPTATEIPPHNPFLPPAVISQVMLIASANQDPITLKFVVSYTMDEETITEMGEATDIPLSAT